MTDRYKRAFYTLVRFPPKKPFKSVEEAEAYVDRVNSSKQCRSYIDATLNYERKSE